MFDLRASRANDLPWTGPAELFIQYVFDPERSTPDHHLTFALVFCSTKTVFFSVGESTPRVHFDVQFPGLRSDARLLFAEDFTFYVLTEKSDGKKDHVVGFFSKVRSFPPFLLPLPQTFPGVPSDPLALLNRSQQEKISYEGFNLNCIITFPPYQKAGYGRLMIEFSYVLTRTGLNPGTPERPLSELGLRGYVSFWSWAVGRALGKLFEEVPRAGKRGLEQEGAYNPSLQSTHLSFICCPVAQADPFVNPLCPSRSANYAGRPGLPRSPKGRRRRSCAPGLAACPTCSVS